MKKQNGFTVVELVVSFVLISIIVVGMLTLALKFRNTAYLSTKRLDLERYKNTVTKAIQDDIFKYGLDDVKNCDSVVSGINYCLTLVFDSEDPTDEDKQLSKNLELSNTDGMNRYIRYGGEKSEIKEDANFNASSLDEANTILIAIQSVKSKVLDNTVYKIDIPIYYVDMDGDFGIHIVALKDDYLSR